MTSMINFDKSDDQHDVDHNKWSHDDDEDDDDDDDDDNVIDANHHLGVDDNDDEGDYDDNDGDDFVND